MGRLFCHVEGRVAIKVSRVKKNIIEVKTIKNGWFLSIFSCFYTTPDDWNKTYIYSNYNSQFIKVSNELFYSATYWHIKGAICCLPTGGLLIPPNYRTSGLTITKLYLFIDLYGVMIMCLSVFCVCLSVCINHTLSTHAHNTYRWPYF